MSQAYYAFFIALIIACFVTPLCRRLAMRTGAMVVPVQRSVHSKPIPHLGGLAIAAGFMAAILIIRPAELATVPMITGGLLVTGLGVVDDVKELRPKVKLLGQVAAALVLVMGGVRINYLTNPLADVFALGWLSIPFTVLWVVGVINVVNLSDGLDGLAAGVASIAAFTLLYVAWHQGQPHMVVATAALAGSALGFLPYNFNPARIFMGDAGSMFLGYILAALSIQGTLKSAAAIALLIPVLALGLPIFDAFFAVVRRASNGKPIYEADRSHLHHRLLHLGLSQRQAVVLMYGVSAMLGFAAILMTALNLRQSGMMLVGIIGCGWAVGKKIGILDLRQEKDVQH
ncbi:MAG: MraY family glycosyltransferase [Bacillota bacterium]